MKAFRIQLVCFLNSIHSVQFVTEKLITYESHPSLHLFYLFQFHFIPDQMTLNDKSSYKFQQTAKFIYNDFKNYNQTIDEEERKCDVLF